MKGNIALLWFVMGILVLAVAILFLMSTGHVQVN